MALFINASGTFMWVSDDDPRSSKPQPRRCACTCTAQGRHCQTVVLEQGERYCLEHREAHVRRTLKRLDRERRADLAEYRRARRARWVPWKEWRPLTDEQVWACTTAINRDLVTDAVRSVERLPCRVTAPDRWYEETTALVRNPASSNWSFARHRPTVRHYLEGKPHRACGKHRNFDRLSLASRVQ